MKIMTILGTRPEIIRLSRILPKLDASCDHTLVHTGQNYNTKLSDIFFVDLRLQEPGVFLGADTEGFGQQVGDMFGRLDDVLNNIRPDKVLILGDTTSGLCAIICERRGIPVYHMEAGNRCFDWRVPEEVNRKIIDSISSYNLPYTPGSKENLLHDGVPKSRIFVTGNPIKEVLDYYGPGIKRSKVLRRLGLKKKKYFLSTFHRAENVDDYSTLKQIVAGLSLAAGEHGMPVVCSIHPRTADKMKTWDITAADPTDVIFCEPFGFFDFVALEESAACIISDSGTVAEEACILGVPNVIIRRSTERPELVECGSSILAGTHYEDILRGVQVARNTEFKWSMPEGYDVLNVSDAVINILLGRHTI